MAFEELIVGGVNILPVAVEYWSIIASCSSVNFRSSVGISNPLLLADSFFGNIISLNLSCSSFDCSSNLIGSLISLGVDL